MDPNKAHGRDEISIRMLKLCAVPISKPLDILFNNNVINKGFPNQWKKVNERDDKQIIKHYRPVSHLPICSKIFENFFFNSLFKYLEDNKLLNCNESGFRSGDSCVPDLQITWGQSLTSCKTCFLDIYKAFDQVGHDGLLYKLKLLRICGRYNHF